MSASSTSRASCCVARDVCIVVLRGRHRLQDWSGTPVLTAFFSELSDVLDRVSTFKDH